MNVLSETKTEVDDQDWKVRPYYKRELAQAYAPDIAPGSALNRLALWINENKDLCQALKEVGYSKHRQVFTSRQVELIFRFLGKP